MLFKGPIPKDLVIDHLCHNTRCVNPDHLELVTKTENGKRKLPRKALRPDVVGELCSRKHRCTELVKSRSGAMRCSKCVAQFERDEAKLKAQNIGKALFLSEKAKQRKERNAMILREWEKYKGKMSKHKFALEVLKMPNCMVNDVITKASVNNHE